MAPTPTPSGDRLGFMTISILSPSNPDGAKVLGTLRLLLKASIVPRTVSNFSQLLSNGKFLKSSFHRIIKGFMAQGGDYEKSDGTGGECASSVRDGRNGQFDDENFELQHVSNVCGVVRVCMMVALAAVVVARAVLLSFHSITQ
jgi:cyclophilin family peptidyl-prolyl cis-trans isomerase